MSGLPDDFAVRRDDIPQQADDDEPGRALPVGILNQLITALPSLEESAGPALRAAVELFMDTGRRPAEICQLGWDCLDQDSDGKYALVYTDFKANRQGRRLPVADETAKVITGQQQRVRARYPDTPASELALFPRTTRNREGKRPVSDSVVASHHRSWVSSLPPLRLEDGREFGKDAVFVYAYRHSFAQRHADAGTPVDVLRDLMGHRSMSTTQLYYRVTAKRVRAAVDTLAAFQFDRGGNRVWGEARALLDSEHQRVAVGQVAVPFGMCSEPSNVKAGGQSCPFRFRCLGCGHFRTVRSRPTCPSSAAISTACCRPGNGSGRPWTSMTGPGPRPCRRTRRSRGCGSSSGGPSTTSASSAKPTDARSRRPSMPSGRPAGQSTSACPPSARCCKKASHERRCGRVPYRRPAP